MNDARRRLGLFLITLGVMVAGVGCATRGATAPSAVQAPSPVASTGEGATPASAAPGARASTSVPHSVDDASRAFFWTVVGKPARGEDEFERVEWIASQLRELPIARTIEFQRELDEVMAESYDDGLWGAAYLINGGCSDDCFEYFRGWLIVQGRIAFVRALADPDSLADLVDEGTIAELEELGSVAREVYEETTGAPMPDDAHPVRYPDLGQTWDFDDSDEARRRLPRLARLFGG